MRLTDVQIQVRDMARQFADEPVAEAGERIAAHIRKFWAPPMIDSLVAEVGRGAEADPAVVEAVRVLG